MMLDWLGLNAAASTIERAVGEAISSGAATPDLKGKLTTQQLGEAIAQRVAAG